LIGESSGSEGHGPGTAACSRSRPLPVIQVARRSPRQRPVSEYSRHGPTAVQWGAFSKAVAHSLAALIDLRCRRYSCSSISRQDALVFDAAFCNPSEPEHLVLHSDAPRPPLTTSARTDATCCVDMQSEQNAAASSGSMALNAAGRQKRMWKASPSRAISLRATLRRCNASPYKPQACAAVDAVSQARKRRESPRHKVQSAAGRVTRRYAGVSCAYSGQAPVETVSLRRTALAVARRTGPNLY
jgi:hypothetical protein